MPGVHAGAAVRCRYRGAGIVTGRAAKMRNVGPKSAAWLRQVGVRDIDELTALGPVEVFLKVKRAGFRPSLNLLYSLEGALVDCHWTDLSDERKQALLAMLESMESANPIRSRWEKQKAASDDGDGFELSDTVELSSEATPPVAPDSNRFD